MAAFRHREVATAHRRARSWRRPRTTACRSEVRRPNPRRPRRTASRTSRRCSPTTPPPAARDQTAAPRQTPPPTDRSGSLAGLVSRHTQPTRPVTHASWVSPCERSTPAALTSHVCNITGSRSHSPRWFVHGESSPRTRPRLWSGCEPRPAATSSTGQIPRHAGPERRRFVLWSRRDRLQEHLLSH